MADSVTLLAAVKTGQYVPEVAKRLRDGDPSIEDPLVPATASTSESGSSNPARNESSPNPPAKS